ncbi:MAG TPA: DUF4388 domain-containing protein [Thermomicrobiales bacterium]|nr:DUF4388 domain-containing protein [Thermomicrobiales bacterium]
MAQTDIHDALVKSEFDFQGRLGNFLISDLLQMIQLSGKTGTLTLLQGWNNRTITFEKGRISYVASGSRLPSQFDLLVRTGRLTRHQVEAFRQRRPGKTEEEMIDELITRKLLDRAAIERCNEQLLESAIYTLFLWRNCAFTFKAGEVNKTNGVVVSVDGNHLIIEGTRRVDEWIEISPVVPSVFMIFRKRPHLVERTIPDHLHKVYDCVNGDRDVTGIARATGISQFDAARALYELAQERFVESNPPNKLKVVELFKLCVESIYMKMVLFERSRLALEFEHELNRFASDNGLRVRMAAGRINRGDIETPLTPVELIELYKTFIGIQNNKLSRLFEPKVFQGLMEGLYLNADPEMQSMMRMYEFFDIDGIAILDMFDNSQPRRQTGPLTPPPTSRTG